MEIVTQYRDNETMRNSFFELAKQVHGLDFSGWYNNGYWSDCYRPYSIWMDGAIVANVSVNEMAFRMEDGVKHFIQLGTVMTKPEYRNRGLIRLLMNRIEEDYAGKVNGWYLFANDSVLDFYPKFGYRKVTEWQAVKQVTRQYIKLESKQETKRGIRQEVEQEENQKAQSEEIQTLDNSKHRLRKVPMETKKDRDVFAKIIQNSIPNAAIDMIDNIGLYMFYLSQFMKDDVYYVEAEDAYMVAELEDEVLTLFAIFANHQVKLDAIVDAIGQYAIDSLGQAVKEVRLGFSPLTMNGFTLEPIQEDNTTTFVKGEAMTFLEQQKVRFPELSHA